MEHEKYDSSILIEGCRKFGVDLSGRQVQQFLDYYEFLTEQNQVMNLTAITEFQEVIVKHFLDSLAIAGTVDMGQCRTLIDVGTGAGFPGIPLKIAFPHLEVVLLDSLNKRVRFLSEAAERLGCRHVKAVHGRAEEFGRQKEYREQFDLAVSRAVANLSSLSEYCLPFVKVGGKFVSYKSTEVEEELTAAGKAIFVLGGELEKKEEFQLPGSEIGRSLILIRKVKKTPGKYPRRAGIPTREPL